MSSSTAKRDLMDIFTRRAAVTTLIATGAFGAIGARLVFLQTKNAFDEEYTKAAEENRFDIRFVVPPRGIIYDRFGDALALSSRDYRVSVVPEEAEDLEATIRTLGELLSMPPETVERRIREAKARRKWDPVLIRNGLEWPQFAAVNVRLPELKGVKVDVGEQRYYPYKSAFAHPIGYVQKPNQREIDKVEAEDRLAAGLPPKAKPGEKFDSPRARYLRNPDVRLGKAGVEAGLDQQLQGEAGWKQVEVNAFGRVVSEVGHEEKKPTPGAAVVLTIDAELQRLAMERMGGESGAIIVMDIWTGDLLVMASAPGFDPNSFVNGIPTAEFKALNEDPMKPLFHKVVKGAYAPGSTFKMIVGIAAKQAGVEDDWHVNCPGYFPFGGRNFHCWKKGGHGNVDMHLGIKYSCDVYFYQAALRAGPDRIAAVARAFGFGQAFDINVPNIEDGVVPDPEWFKRVRGTPWTAGLTVNFGIGQGDLLVTPIQLATMAARLGNDGHGVIPRLVRDGPGVKQPGKPPLISGIDASHLAKVRDGMFGVCNEGGGTATRAGDLQLVRRPDGVIVERSDATAGFEPVRIAGKTGTAQVRVITAAERARGVISNANLDWKLRDNALFVCFGPWDNPRYACAVVVEHGGGGSAVAGPIARDVMRATLLRDPSAREPMTLARSTLMPVEPKKKKGKA